MSEFGMTELLFVLLAIVAIALVFLYSRSQKSAGESKSSYLEALELLIDGHETEAVQKFKEAIGEDSGQLAPYLRLGDLLRKRGLASNAVRVHRELTLRENLSAADRQRIYRSLILDYEAVGDYQKGIEVTRQLLAAQRKPELWVIEKLLSFLEKSEQWSEAEEVFSKHAKALGMTSRNERLALYKLFSGLKLEKAGKTKEARSRLQDAIKKDPQCAAAFYYLGKFQQKEGNIDEAIALWTRLCQVAPQKAHFVFAELEKAWFEIGRFNDAESLYQDLISSGEILLPAGLALAEIYHKKGDQKHAIEVLDQLGESFPDSAQLAMRKIAYLDQGKRYQDAAREALSFLKRGNRQSVSPDAQCLVCQDLVETPEWICQCSKQQK